MRLAPDGHRGIGVDRRAGERVAELDRTRPHRDQAGALGGRERRQVGPEPPCGALEHREIAAIAGRDERQRPAHRLVEGLHPPQKSARDARRDQQRCALGRERQLVGFGCELEQRERVAGRFTVQARGGRGRQPAEQGRPPRCWSGRRFATSRRSAPSSSDGSPSRTAITAAIGSATSRRSANNSACALDPSSQWASSTSTATGPRSA